MNKNQFPRRAQLRRLHPSRACVVTSHASDMLAARLQAIGGTRTCTSQDSQHCRLLRQRSSPSMVLRAIWQQPESIRTQIRRRMRMRHDRAHGFSNHSFNLSLPFCPAPCIGSGHAHRSPSAESMGKDSFVGLFCITGRFQ